MRPKWDEHLRRMAVERLDVLEEPRDMSDRTHVPIYCARKSSGQGSVWKRTGRCTFCGAKVRVLWDSDEAMTDT